MNQIVIILITKLFIISAKSAKDIQRIADSGFNYYNIQHQGMMLSNFAYGIIFHNSINSFLSNFYTY